MRVGRFRMRYRKNNAEDQFSTLIERAEYFLRRDVHIRGVHLRAGTHVRMDTAGRYHALDGSALPLVSDSDVCCLDYRGVTLFELRCDDDGLLFSRRFGTQEDLEPVSAAHVGFELQRGCGCVCVNYGGRYFSLEFFGW